jgi:hypothetical protein
MSSVPPPVGAWVYDPELVPEKTTVAAARGRQCISIGVELPVFDDEDSIGGRIDDDVSGELEVAANRDISAQVLSAGPLIAGGKQRVFVLEGLLRIRGASVRPEYCLPARSKGP